MVAEWSETQSNVRLDGFRSRLCASCVSSHTETVCLWMTIYIYIVVCVSIYLYTTVYIYIVVSHGSIPA